MRRNPLIFDNRFDPEPMKRYPRSRVVASIVAPPRQRAQVERLADSPHTFRVIVVDAAPDLDAAQLAQMSQPGSITLVVLLATTAGAESASVIAAKQFGRGAQVGLYSAFTLLHRLGDVLLEVLASVVMGKDTSGLFTTYGFSVFKTQRGASRMFIPAQHLSIKTMHLSDEIRRARFMKMGNRAPLWPSDETLANYIVHNTNSHMSREGIWFHKEESAFSPEFFDTVNMTQCLADWLALSEMPSARARPGRGEPWLLFPPKTLRRKRIFDYVKIINAYFPAFAQSLLDDLDGSVFVI